MRGDEHFGFRGRTFSPAEEWRDGGEEFAKGKLGEVAAMLVELSHGEEVRPRRRWWCFWRGERSLARRVDWQRVHDLIDAASTVRDARCSLGGPMAPSPGLPPDFEADAWPFDDDPPDPL